MPTEFYQDKYTSTEADKIIHTCSYIITALKRHHIPGIDAQLLPLLGYCSRLIFTDFFSASLVVNVSFATLLKTVTTVPLNY